MRLPMSGTSPETAAATVLRDTALGATAALRERPRTLHPSLPLEIWTLAEVARQPFLRTFGACAAERCACDNIPRLRSARLRHRIRENSKEELPARQPLQPQIIFFFIDCVPIRLFLESRSLQIRNYLRILVRDFDWSRATAKQTVISELFSSGAVPGRTRTRGSRTSGPSSKARRARRLSVKRRLFTNLCLPAARRE